MIIFKKALISQDQEFKSTKTRAWIFKISYLRSIYIRHSWKKSPQSAVLQIACFGKRRVLYTILCKRPVQVGEESREMLTDERREIFIAFDDECDFREDAPPEDSAALK